MISGIVSTVSGQVAYVIVKGESESRKNPIKFEKGRAPTVGDEVVIADVDGAKRIVGIY